MKKLVLHCVADPSDHLLVDWDDLCISFEIGGAQEPSVPIVLHEEEATRLRDFINLFLEGVIDA